MLGTNEYADNLFVRLSSYSPRKERDPLEDFCSEALVWCLRQSLTFRKEFFKLSELNFLKPNSGLTIHSQQSYEEESDGTVERKRQPGGRFDIAFEGKDSSFFVALESKIGAAFGPNQIEKYLRRLESLKKLHPVMQCALLTLTNVREGPVETDQNVKHIFWGDVHNKLEIAARTKRGASADESAMLFKVLQQFAEFLKLKGLAYMNIPPVNSASLEQFIDLRKGIQDILTSLKTSKHLKSHFAGKSIRFDPPTKGGDAFLGLYGSPEPFFFYIGFQFHRTGTPSMSLFIERSVKGNRTDRIIPRELKKYYRPPREFARGQTWFDFAQPVDERLNGDAEAMRRWFHETSELVLTRL
jgi:hypothetical protein